MFDSSLAQQYYYLLRKKGVYFTYTPSPLGVGGTAVLGCARSGNSEGSFLIVPNRIFMTDWRSPANNFFTASERYSSKSAASHPKSSSNQRT